jgi:hypothetical protein
LNHFTFAFTQALDGMDRRRMVDREHAQALVAFLALHRLAGDARAFQRRLEAIALQAAQVNEHILHAIVGNDEAVAPPGVEPLHETVDLDNPDVGFRRLTQAVNPFPSRSATRRHDLTQPSWSGIS